MQHNYGFHITLKKNLLEYFCTILITTYKEDGLELMQAHRKTTEMM